MHSMWARKNVQHLLKQVSTGREFRLNCSAIKMPFTANGRFLISESCACDLA
jgi:hypothetical protein